MDWTLANWIALLQLWIITSSHGAKSSIENTTTTTNLSGVFSEIDFETLSMFGVTPELAEEFRLNLLKAIESLKEQDEGLRQNEFEGQGGVSPGGQEEEEGSDEETPVAATPGPGAFGVLSGLFGIFSGLGTLNPSRIIQSTVNFFPPGRRMQAQMVVDSLIGFTPPENKTFRPRTEKPRTTPITLLMQENSTMDPLSAMDTNATIVDALNSSSIPNPGNDTMTGMLTAKDSESNAQGLITTTPGFINLKELLNMTSTAVPPTDEDDEIDFENRQNSLTPIKTGGPYKRIMKPKPEVLSTTQETVKNATLAVAAKDNTDEAKKLAASAQV